MFEEPGTSSSEKGHTVARIILLNGASSSGKSTLARAIQEVLDEPFVHLASDYVSLGLPKRRDTTGPFRWWNGYRGRFFDGFQHSIAAFAGAGNDLIVDHIIEFADWRERLRVLLAPFDVYLVGVHCALNEIDSREAARGDRRIGEGRLHVEEDMIHEFGRYDLEVDTTKSDPDEIARLVVIRWRARQGPSALLQ